MFDTRILRQFDWILLTCMLSIITLGIMMIYSATYQGAHADLYLRQLQYFIVGMILFIIILQVDYHFLTDGAAVFYIISILMLIAVLFFGKRISGAKSWFALGYFNFQPSEIAKIASILFLARYLSMESRSTNLTLKDLGMAALIMGIPMVLIILQPDMGTTLTFLPPLVFLLFFAGMRLKWMFFGVLAGLATMPFGWYFLKPYQRDRITTFIDPSNDPLGAGYQIIQSKIAIGSGMIWGKGLLSKETQAYLDFIPEKQTDFVFSILAEDFGFIGVMIALGLYFLLISRLLNAASQARDRVGTYVIVGIMAVFFFHVVVNIGMVIGLMPITGLPLPLMSYGGSSLLSTMVGLAIVMNIRMRRFVN
jgi:rod shape determining protein RodA